MTSDYYMHNFYYILNLKRLFIDDNIIIWLKTINKIDVDPIVNILDNESREFSQSNR